MSSHVLLNLLNELRKRDKMRGLLSILSLFQNDLNKFNNTITIMKDSIPYDYKNTLKSFFFFFFFFCNVKLKSLPCMRDIVNSIITKLLNM